MIRAQPAPDTTAILRRTCARRVVGVVGSHCGWLVALLAVASAALAAPPDRVAGVIAAMRANGYKSPAAMIATLRHAWHSDAATASADTQLRYYGALMSLALPDRNRPLLQESLANLKRLAETGDCRACQALWLIGEAHAVLFDYKVSAARDFLQQAEPLVAVNDLATRLALARAKLRLGRTQGTLDLAYADGMTALRLAEQLDDDATRADILDSVASIEAGLGYLDRALKTSKEAASIAESIGYTATLAAIQIDQGYIYSLRQEREKQLQALQKALHIALSVAGLDYIEAAARANLSDYYLVHGDNAAAITQAKAAVKLARANNDPYNESVGLANRGIASARSGHTAEGLALLRQALGLARKAGPLQLQIGINQEIVKALESMGRYRDALQALRALDDVNNQITRQERDSAVLALQAKYDDERKDREIERLSTQTRIGAAESAARQWQLRLWIALAAIALVIVLVMVARLLHARRANRELTRSVADLTEQSSTDQLTGVLNRRSALALMQRLAAGGSTHIGVAMVDIDHFKHVNDTYGHDFGDMVLLEVTRRLQQFGRSHDHAIRWGGEEFVLVMPEASPHYLPAAAQRLLQAVAGSPFQIGGRLLGVSVSAGFASHPLLPDASWEQALRVADAAMYRAKRGGRNRAVCVTGIADPRVGELADANLDAFIESGAIRAREVPGPELAARPQPPAPAPA